MIYTIKGDLLKSDCSIIAHQCNCFGKMGAGIAKQIKRLYPAAYDADQQYVIPVGDPKRLGKLSVAAVGNKVVFNLYGQYRYGKGKQTDYHALERSLKNMFWVISNSLKKPETIKLGMPYKIGCGLAGGDWNRVERILKELSGEYKQDIYLYQL